MPLNRETEAGHCQEGPGPDKERERFVVAWVGDGRRNVHWGTEAAATCQILEDLECRRKEAGPQGTGCHNWFSRSVCPLPSIWPRERSY